MAQTPPVSGYSSTGQIRLRSMLRAIRNSNVSVFYQTPDLNYSWAENLPEFWHLPWQNGISETDLMPKDLAVRLTNAKKQLLVTGDAQRLELSFPDKNTPRWYEFFIDGDRDEDGRIIGVVTTAVEISELKHREQVLKILLREVSHRSKNLLAIIQSIAMQTARFSGSVDQFLQKFRGRLHSLSHSQDLVTDSNWHGADFRELLYSQLEKYIHPKDPRLAITGKDAYLFPGAALHVGLAFHELIVNSASYGALACESGHLEISAELEPDGEGEMDLIIHWKETTCPPDKTDSLTPLSASHQLQHDIQAENKAKTPEASRFGSAVLLRIVPQAVSGTAHYKIEDNCVDYYLRIPHRNFDF
ncbi:MAG: PAS domain-containing protein [Brucellaceae bacterium]|nr:PAS domain-containing protein [Brucellaceae bacterium]